MKKIITIITLLFALSVNVSAYKVVKFTIRDGISDKALKDNMERTVTRLLNEIPSPAGLTKANHSPPSCCLIPSDISLAMGDTPDWKT